jgi:hypothetical protein
MNGKTDYLVIGSTPHGEDCAQLGSDDYMQRMRRETAAFIGQIKRVYGEPPEGCKLVVKGFPHDFGTYHEVCAVYEVGNGPAQMYAFAVEEDANEGLGEWDAEAKRDLGISGQ